MLHRHLNHGGFSLSAIDDVIARGKRPDWEELREAILDDPSLLETVRGICLQFVHDPYARRYHFWLRYVREDADHILVDLRSRFDQVLAELESVAGWKTARINRPVQILGSLDGIETGIRQLIREEPLETMEIDHLGQKIKLPTLPETLRIKAALIIKRNATRDYLDFVALADRFGEAGTISAMRRFDELYPQPNGESALQQLQIQLANPMPFDLKGTNLAEYKNLNARWHDWEQVKEASAVSATALFEKLARERSIKLPHP